jgi:deoxyadenosine/deoxycytidine kinase
MGAFQIAIAGMIASGKTTLAEQLARLRCWPRVGESALGLEYLPDLFRDQSRWALEAQIAFITEKAIQVRRATAEGSTFLIERTLDEDASIFARHFRDHACIDERSGRLYDAVLEALVNDLPHPDLVVVCTVSLATAEARVSERAKSKDKLYPVGHVAEIARRYAQWRGPSQAPPTLSLDSEAADWRRPDVANAIGARLEEILNKSTSNSSQLRLFSETQAPESTKLVGGAADLVPMNEAAVKLLHGQWPIRSDAAAARRPVAYLAAPFTSEEEVPLGSGDQLRLFRGKLRGQIPPGGYRAALMAVEASLSEAGLEILLPHRDVSRWGTVPISDRSIAIACTTEVLRSDLFVGLLGLSLGAHYECGLALGSGIPALLISCADLQESLIAAGLSALGDLFPPDRARTLHIRVRSLEEVPEALRQEPAISFMRLAVRRCAEV